MTVNLQTTHKDLFLQIHFFKRVDEIATTPVTLFTKNFESELYDDYFSNEENLESSFESKYSFKGVNYNLSMIEFDDLSRIKSSYSLHNQLYKYLGCHFDNHLKPDFRIRPDLF
jgi:hypothetical protein